MNDKNIVAKLEQPQWHAEQYDNGVVFMPTYWVTKVGEMKDPAAWEAKAKKAGAFTTHNTPQGMTAMFSSEDKARAFAESC